MELNSGLWRTSECTHGSQPKAHNLSKHIRRLELIRKKIRDTVAITCLLVGMCLAALWLAGALPRAGQSPMVIVGPFSTLLLGTIFLSMPELFQLWVRGLRPKITRIAHMSTNLTGLLGPAILGLIGFGLAVWATLADMSMGIVIVGCAILAVSASGLILLPRPRFPTLSHNLILGGATAVATAALAILGIAYGLEITIGNMAALNIGLLAILPLTFAIVLMIGEKHHLVKSLPSLVIESPRALFGTSIGILSTGMLVRFIGLDIPSINPDAQQWIGRGTTYIADQVLENRPLGEALLNSHGLSLWEFTNTPGVTSAILASASLWSLGDSLGPILAARLPFALIGVLTPVVLFLLARHIWGNLIALIGALLLALDPFHIALTRVIHVDGMLTMFFMTSLLAFYLAEERNSWRLHLLAGLCFALAFLTKTPAVLLLPSLVIIRLTFVFREYQKERKFPVPVKWIDLGNVCIGILFLYVFFPDIYKGFPGSFMEVVLGAGEIVGRDFEPIWFLGELLPSAPWYFYIVLLGARLPELPLVMAVVGVALAVAGKTYYRSPTMLVIVIPIVLYISCMSLSAKVDDRYLLPIWPLLMISAGIGSVAVYKATTFLIHPARWFRRALLGTSTAMVIILPILMYPYPYLYYTHLVGGTLTASQSVPFGWGDGTRELVEYVQTHYGSRLGPGEWYHIVGTYDGKNVKLYVNGILRDSTPQSGVIKSSGDLFLGTRSGIDSVFEGALDEVRIYSMALSDSEVYSLYQSTFEKGLIGYWSMDENTVIGSSLLDTLNRSSALMNNGPSIVNGYSNEAIQLDGVDDYVRINGSDFNNLREITVATWVKYAYEPKDLNRYLITKDDYSFFLYSRGKSSQDIRFYIANEAGTSAHASFSMDSKDAVEDTPVSALGYSLDVDFYHNGNVNPMHEGWETSDLLLVYVRKRQVMTPRTRGYEFIMTKEPVFELKLKHVPVGWIYEAPFQD